MTMMLMMVVVMTMIPIVVMMVMRAVLTLLTWSTQTLLLAPSSSCVQPILDQFELTADQDNDDYEQYCNTDFNDHAFSGDVDDHDDDDDVR